MFCVIELNRKDGYVMIKVYCDRCGGDGAFDMGGLIVDCDKCNGTGYMYIDESELDESDTVLSKRSELSETERMTVDSIFPRRRKRY